MIKAIFFDIGGTLVSIADFEDSYTAKKLGVDAKKFPQIGKKYNKPCETGKISDNEFLEKVAKSFGLNKKTLKKNWLKIYGKRLKFYKGTYRIAYKLKRAGYKIGIISNVKKMYTAIIKRKGVLKGFPIVILSYKVGFVKPDKKIYAVACKAAKVKPSETIFIDDRIKNVKGAKNFGEHAIQYKNPQQLENDLRRLGLKF